MFDASVSFPLPVRTLTGARALELVAQLPVDELVRQGRVRLSLRLVEEIDEGGVGALVRLDLAAAKLGAKLVLVDVRAPIADHLREIGLQRLCERAPRAPFRFRFPSRTRLAKAA